MKKLIIVLTCLLLAAGVKAQDITGSWLGSISVGGTNLHLVLNIKKSADSSYTSTLDSPDQKAFGITCNKTFLKKDSLFIAIATIGGGYAGVWDEKDGINGIYKQGGGKIALALKRISAADKADLRCK